MGVFVHVCATLLTTTYNPEAIYPSATLMVSCPGGWLAGLQEEYFDLANHGCCPGYYPAQCLARRSITHPRSYPGHVEHSATALQFDGFGPSRFGSYCSLAITSILYFCTWGWSPSSPAFFVLRPEFAAPALQTHPQGAPPLFPFVFIVVACGAISGFHGLVSSGTTAKQINKESDATLIGYGGMIGESLLGLASVLACTAGFLTRDLWMAHYNSWELADGLGPNMKAFIDGSALFISQLGLPLDVGKAFVALVAISFALTTLDSATRLLRFNISEMSENSPAPIPR